MMTDFRSNEGNLWGGYGSAPEVYVEHNMKVEKKPLFKYLNRFYYLMKVS